MSTPKKQQSKVKITVYYWKKGPGAGHIACEAQEIGGLERRMHISPGYMEQYAGGLVRQKSAELFSNDLENYLEIEMAYWKENPIKIELPESLVSYDDFLETFSADIESDIKKGYSLFWRNCAHHTSKALTAAYLEYNQPLIQLGLLPSKVANSACDILGEEYKEQLKLVKDNVNTHSSQESLVGYVSKYQFAKSVMITTLSKIQTLLYDELQGSNIEEVNNALYSNFVKATRAFVAAVSVSPPLNDIKLTEEFKKIENYMTQAQGHLNKERRGSFDRSNQCLATSGCILADNPANKLEQFKQELQSYYKIYLEKSQTTSSKRSDVIDFAENIFSKTKCSMNSTAQK